LDHLNPTVSYIKTHLHSSCSTILLDFPLVAISCWLFCRWSDGSLAANFLYCDTTLHNICGFPIYVCSLYCSFCDCWAV